MMKSKIHKEMVDIAGQVMERHAVPSLTEVALQLAMIEKRRTQLMNMLDYRAVEMSQPIDEDQYQMLMDFLMLQAAKKNVDSEELVLELEFKFVLTNLRHLSADKIWDAMTFIRVYNEKRSY